MHQKFHCEIAGYIFNQIGCPLKLRTDNTVHYILHTLIGKQELVTYSHCQDGQGIFYCLDWIR